MTTDKYHETDRYPIKGWHDAFNEVSANSIMQYSFWTSTIKLDSQTVILYLSSHRLQKEVSATISLIEFITCAPVLRLAYIRELKTRLLQSADDNPATE
jgi:hypothetical protein